MNLVLDKLTLKRLKDTERYLQAAQSSVLSPRSCPCGLRGFQGSASSSAQ